jgi:hypothetical protein
MVLFLENREVIKDQQHMKEVYDGFLAKTVQGKPLSERIKPETLAVFKIQKGMVACGVMN